MHQRDQPRRWVLVGLLLLLGVVFVMRGPVRGVGGGSDLIHLYAAAVVFVDGGDPYDGEACVAAARAAGYPNPEHVSDGSLYPATTLAAMSPMGLLSWEVARGVWLVINLLGCGVLVGCGRYWLTAGDGVTRWLVAGLLVAMWGPVSTTLWLGQLSVVVSALLFGSLVAIDRDRRWLAGVLIGFGCVVKPQLGLGFLVLVLLLRCWPAAVGGIGVLLLFAGAGYGRMFAALGDAMVWVPRPVGSALGEGGIMDAGLAGPMRYQMIDLHPLLHLVLPRGAVGVSALAVVGLLAALAVAGLARLGLRRRLLVLGGGVGLMLMLPVYHRYYDAVLVLPLLVWLVNSWAAGRLGVWGWVVLVAMVPLCVPLAALLVRLSQRGVIGPGLTEHGLWRYGVLQHQSWLLLIAALAMVAWVWTADWSDADGGGEAMGDRGSSA